MCTKVLWSHPPHDHRAVNPSLPPQSLLGTPVPCPCQSLLLLPQADQEAPSSRKPSGELLLRRLAWFCPGLQARASTFFQRLGLPMSHCPSGPPGPSPQALPVLVAALASQVLTLRSWRGCGGVWEGCALGWVEVRVDLGGGPDAAPNTDAVQWGTVMGAALEVRQ